jgi:hypothetical protein
LIESLWKGVTNQSTHAKMTEWVVMRPLTKASKKKSGREAISFARDLNDPIRMLSSAKALDRERKSDDTGFVRTDGNANCGFSKYACKTIQTSRGGMSFRMNLANEFDLEGGERCSTQR